MIDFIKIRLKVGDKDIRKNDLLDWKITINKDGEITGESCEYNRLKITVKKNIIHISGSIHKYYNNVKNGDHQNYDDFPYHNLLYSIRDLCQKLNLNPFQCILENVEVGVNVQPDMSPNEILDDVVLHKNKEFKRDHVHKKYFIECPYQQYYIKMYNKSAQFQQMEHILRFEKKVAKMINIRRYGIYTLADLLVPKKLYLLGQDLLDAYDGLLYTDHSVSVDSVSKRDKLFFTEGKNPIYWLELRKKYLSTYHKRRKRYIALILKYSTINIKSIVRILIEEKLKELLKIDIQDIVELSEFLSTYPEYQAILGDYRKYSLQRSLGSQERIISIYKMLKQGNHQTIQKHVLGSLDNPNLGTDKIITDDYEGFDELLDVLHLHQPEKIKSSGREWAAYQEVPVYDSHGKLIRIIKL